MKTQSSFTGAVKRAALMLIVGSAIPLIAYGTVQTGQPPGTPAPAAEAVRLSGGAQDILKLTKAKVNDDVTLAFIRNSDHRYDLTAAEIIHLREAGVTDRVLAEMLIHQPAASSAPPAPTPLVETQPAAVASAPQYVMPPAESAVVETAPPTTVYVTSTAPAYYSFSDPWPYYWSSSYSYWPYYWYPYCSVGWYWGWGGYWNSCYYNSCNYNNWNCHNGNWDNNCNNGNNGGSDGRSGNPPPTRGDSFVAATSGRPAAGGNQNRLASANPARTDAARSTPATRSTSFWSNNGNQSAGASPASVAPSANSQTPRPGAAGGNGAGSRTVATRPTVGGPAATKEYGTAQPAGRSGANQPVTGLTTASSSARPTSYWNGNGQTPVTRTVPNRSVAAAAAPNQTAGRSTTTFSRPVNQSANSYASRPTMNYSRSSVSSVSRSVSARPSGGGNYSRSSMSAPSRSMGSTSSFRGSGGGFSGGGAARPSMSGGGVSRGGGGGGGRSR